MTGSRAARQGSGTGALVPEMLAGHGLMMRLAAAANGFLEQGGDAVPNLSLHAVRTAGLVARLMDRYRRGIALLDRVSRADPNGAFAAAVRAHWVDGCRAAASSDHDGQAASAAPPPPTAAGGGLGRLRHGNPP